MKIIYHCYGGAHSSVTASSIHLGWLPMDRMPENEELLKVPYFDRPIDKDHGHIRFMGYDEYNNEIYCVGRRNSKRILENVCYGISDIYGLNEKDVRLVDVMPYVNIKMVIGGFTSRRLHITPIGRPIIIYGVKSSYWKIVNMVKRVKQEINK